jgi:hypothetical protein
MKRDVSAARMSKQVYWREPQRLDEGDHVGRVLLYREGASLAIPLLWVVVPQAESDDAIPLAQ